MKTLKLFTLSIALALPISASAAPAEDKHPSVVIVHGAFADGSDWARVIPILQAEGVRVTAVQNPLTSLADDVAATERALDNQPGEVVLVGHSWGGTVISEAGKHDKVSALVYVAAFAPNAGQTSAEQGKGFPAAPGLSQLITDGHGYLYLSPQSMASDFAQDLPAPQTTVMAATQGPIKASAFDDKTTVAAWESKPSWYVLASQDRMIHPDLQRATAQRIGAHVVEVGASHVPQQSQPAKVAEAILAAVHSSEQR